MKRVVVPLIILMLSAVVASAEQKADITFRLTEGENPTVTVSGAVTDRRRAYEQITLEVLKCGECETDEEGYQAALAAFSSVGENEDMTGLLMHYASAMTDTSGNYQFSFAQEKTSGTYAIRLRGEYADEAEYYIYTYVDAGELAAILEKMNAASAAELAGLIDDNAKKLNVSTETYDSLDKSKACAILIGLKGNGFESSADFADKFEEAVAVEQMNEAASAAAVQSIIERNEEILKITQTKFYPTFSSLQKVQTLVYDALSKLNNFARKEDVQTAFCEKGFLIACEKMDYWSQMRPIITQNAEWLGLDLKDYKGSKAERADVAMVGKHYENIPAWKTAFYESMKETGGSGGSSGSGGGSGSGGSSGVSIGTGLLPTTGKDTKPKGCRFSDMSAYAWAADAVESLAEIGVVSGYEDGKYMPEKPVTRGEFVKMAACAFKLVKNGSRCDFKDVSRDDWQYVYVASLYTTGVVSGKTDDEFGADDEITREQIAAILARISESMGKTVPKLRAKIEFTDEESISEFAKNAVETMQAAGVISGREDGTFAPDASATRAEAAVMIHKLYEIIMTGEAR